MGDKGMRLAHWARIQPEVVAVQSIWGDRTFGELNANSNRLARALRARGLRDGDGVAIVCSNRPEFAEVVHACLRAGLRYTPVNWHLTPDEVAYIVSDCQAKAVFGDTRFAELVAKAAALCTERHGASCDRRRDCRFSKGTTPRLRAEDESDISDPKPGFRMLYTSGTTGKTQGCGSSAKLLDGSRRVDLGSPIRSGKKASSIYALGPCTTEGHWCTPWSVPISQGVGTVLMDKWDAAEALRLIEQASHHAHAHGSGRCSTGCCAFPKTFVAATPTSPRCSTSRTARHHARSAPRRR